MSGNMPPIVPAPPVPSYAELAARAATGDGPTALRIGMLERICGWCDRLCNTRFAAGGKFEERLGGVNSLSDDGRVIVGQSDLPMMGIRDATIYTPGMGWMLLGDFLQSQGVLEASRWILLHAEISGNGKTLIGTGFPLAADYWHGFRLELDQVFVCHGKGSAATTLRVGFPDSMDVHLTHGDAVGLCPGDQPK